MKNNCSLLISFLLLSLSFNAFAGEKIVLAIGEWGPYVSETNYRDKILEVIVKEAFIRQGIEVEYKYFPWKRSLERVRNGLIIGSFPWWSDEKREQDFIINNEPLLVAKEVFFHLKSTDFKWEKMDDLKKYKIGGTLSFEHIERFKKQGIALDIAVKEDLSFKKLLAGRIDALPADFIVGYATINRLFSPAKVSLFTNHPKVSKQAGMYMLLSREFANAQKTAEKLDLGLKELKKSGRYDEIIMEFMEMK
ncbi:substrate-binding periplasmic protein [Psychromonas ossibalaenae]|uniref:substrate-binding periplasmic protein n=1 Tax=Psychromonas ossibalaenae TaxID=444922 RepID=UPI00035F1985|nr:transporter substrate-binding domain-containing protein [Psychromonas ossibalaenae]